MVQQAAEVSLFKLLREGLAQGLTLTQILTEAIEQGTTLDALLAEALLQGVSLADILAIQELSELAAPADLIYSHLVTGAASHDMAIDAVAADAVFRYTCPVDRIAELHRLNLWGVDNNKIVPNGFFSIAALGAGDGMLIRLVDTDDSVLFDLTNGEELLHHAHLGMLAGVDVEVDSTANLSCWIVRWTFSAGAGGPILLSAGQHLEITIRADLSDFEEFEAMAQGRLRDV